VKLQQYEVARRYFMNVLTEYSETPLYGDALIGWAVASARLGERDTALVVLGDLEKQFAGQALGDKAARTKAEVAKWSRPPKPAKRRAAPNEPAQVAVPGGGLP
jgi:hypothetical protein